ncbi:MAG: hypothetical protein ACRDQA_11845 [Nocardioidaceae bacterium]
MSTTSGRDIVAVDPDAPPRPQDLPPGLTAMFDAYDRHGFHGGNNLVLRTILHLNWSRRRRGFPRDPKVRAKRTVSVHSYFADVERISRSDQRQVVSHVSRVDVATLRRTRGDDDQVSSLYLMWVGLDSG